MKRSLSLALLVLLLFGACDTGAPSGASSKASSESSAIAVSICRYIARCMPAALRMFSKGAVASCEARFTCGGGGLAALAGDSGIDEAACALEIDSATCGELSLGSTGRSPRLRPSAGSACAGPKPIARGPHAGSGERCISEEGACAEGLYCKLDEPLKSLGDKLCGVCTAEAALGEPCPPGTHCNGDTFCELGECIARQQIGSKCSTSAQCAEDTCVDGRCAPNPYFHLVADGGAEGDACELTRPSACRGDLTLTCLDGRCRRRPDQGEPCRDISSCRVGLACEDGRCRAPLGCTSKVGARCGPDARYVCFGDTYCTGPSTSEARCAPRIVGHHELDACNIGCDGEGLSCLDGSCVRSSGPEYGGACDSSFDCPEAACDRDIAPYCSLTDGSLYCSIPPCGRCGRCVPKPKPESCDEAVTD